MNRMRALPVLCTAMCLVATGASARDLFADEAAPELTAAFIINFARYTTWPDGQREADRPLVVLVLGDERIAHALKRLQGEPLHGRRVQTVCIPRDRWEDADRSALRQRLAGADVLFVGSDFRTVASEVLEGVSDANTLTIGCFPGFARRGGMLNLQIRDERIRFEANPDSIERSALRISSEVLGLAKIVGEGGES